MKISIYRKVGTVVVRASVTGVRPSQVNDALQALYGALSVALDNYDGEQDNDPVNEPGKVDKQPTTSTLWKV